MENTTLNFAKEEFLRYSALSFTDFNGSEVYIGLPYNGEIEITEKDDEYYIDVVKNRGVILGSNYRSVLFAVYRFFKECGCRFLRPGKDGEYIKVQSINKVAVKLQSKADLRYRGIVIEGACSYQNVLDVIDFMPKIGLNRYRFQFKNAGVFFERWYNHLKNPFKETADGISDSQINKTVTALKAEVVKRGIFLHTMGHGFTAYPFGLEVKGWEKVETELLPEINDCYAFFGGKRGLLDGKPFMTALCLSNPLTKQKIGDYLVNYCKQNPNVSCVVFSTEDAINISCECESCADKRPSDLTVELLNYIDERLSGENIDTTIAAGAYLSTLWAPIYARLNNPERFIFKLCPITRRHHEPLPYENIPDSEPAPYILNRLTNPTSVVDNLRYMKAWQKSIGGYWLLGDYHFMWAHYSDIGYQKISRVLSEDIKNLKKLDLNGMVMFQPQRCSMPTAMGFQVLGETLWNTKTDFDALSKDYFAHSFGENWEKAYNLLQWMSDTFDMKINRAGRSYKIEYCPPVFKEIIEKIENFQKDFENEAEKHTLGVEKVSWFILGFHLQYCLRYLPAFIAGIEGNEAAGREIIADTERWLWENEEKIQPYLDIYIMQSHLTEWYNRTLQSLYEDKKIEIEQKADGNTAEGFQG